MKDKINLNNLTIASYTRNRIPAITRFINFLQSTLPINNFDKLNLLVIEDASKEKLRNNLSTINKTNTNLNIVEFPSKSSCSKLINSCMVLPETRYVLICNDDITFKPFWINKLNGLVSDKNFAFCLLYNFGAMLVDRKYLSKEIYMDERFLGGNREDQDLMIRTILNETPHFNFWHEMAEPQYIGHENIFLSLESWDGRQNESYFSEKWGTLDYSFLISEAKAGRIKPKFKEIDWYPSQTARISSSF